MYFWNSYPFIRFVIALILGIIAHDLSPELWRIDLTVAIALFILLIVTASISAKYGFYKVRHANGVLAISLIFLLGGSISKLQNSHLSNHYKNSNKSIHAFSGVINSPPNERSKYFRFDFSLESVISEADSILVTSGKIHLYVKKDSQSVDFGYGDRLIVFGKLYPVPGPDNPNEFNYKKYLERENIYSHSFVKLDNIKVMGTEEPNIFLSFAYTIRNRASQTIDKYIPSSRENGIAKALLLGIKDYLENDIKKAYSAAGAMHVLAVSGLHVGIIFMIIQAVFGKVQQAGKIGRYFFGLISLIIIWLYACLTGLSPSVLRAATMFSFISISQFSESKGNIYNTLGFSAFVLLLVNPNLIYSVGFQLSYAAVIGIVYIQPLLYRLICSRYWVIDKAWAITCVSLAAQLATFPLSAYYFHQFPTYFLVSNLVVIPSSSLLLISGISMIVLDQILSQASELIGFFLHHFIWSLNEVISFVHLMPNSLIEWIYIDKLSLILIYLIVISLISSFHFHSFKTLIFTSFNFILLVTWISHSHEVQSERRELIFYEIANTTAIDLIDGHSSMLYLDKGDRIELELVGFQINPHRLASHLKPIEESLDSLAFYKSHNLKQGIIGGKRVILFDTTTYHLSFTKKIDSDFIVINNQSVKSLKWLKEHFDFDQIIIGTKNPIYYSRKMKRQADKLGLSIHSIVEDGALRYSLNQDKKKERTIMSALFTTNPD